MSNKKKREKAAMKQAEIEKRKQLIEDMRNRVGNSKYQYEAYSTISDTNNEMWGKFVMPGHKVHIHVSACVCGSTSIKEKVECKVYITVRANWDDSCALSKHIYSSDIDEVIATFEEYKKLAENIPETTNWRWYIDRGFQYYQV